MSEILCLSRISHVSKQENAHVASLIEKSLCVLATWKVVAIKFSHSLMGLLPAQQRQGEECMQSTWHESILWGIDRQISTYDRDPKSQPRFEEHLYYYWKLGKCMLPLNQIWTLYEVPAPPRCNARLRWPTSSNLEAPRLSTTALLGSANLKSKINK